MVEAVIELVQRVRDLADRIEALPVMYGVGGEDASDLRRVADALEARGWAPAKVGAAWDVASLAHWLDHFSGDLPVVVPTGDGRVAESLARMSIGAYDEKSGEFVPLEGTQTSDTRGGMALLLRGR